jgi:hypothetical protein
MEFQLVYEQVLGNYACLWKPVHAFLYLAINVSVRSCNLIKVVMIDDVDRYVGEFQSHVLLSSHGGV